jgi:hypothetical protein
MPLYFAYGSNMDPDLIRQRCPFARFRFVARAPGFRLAFTRFSAKRKCGVADIVPDVMSEVWGAVFAICEKDTRRLDRVEGVFLTPPAYRRIPLRVWPADRDHAPAQAFAYEVVNKARAPIPTNAEYMKLLNYGGREMEPARDLRQYDSRVQSRLKELFSYTDDHFWAEVHSEAG